MKEKIDFIFAKVEKIKELIFNCIKEIEDVIKKFIEHVKSNNYIF